MEKANEMVLRAGSPGDLIIKAVEGKADLDKLEKLLALQERWEANEARKMYASSFAEVQKNIASVLKSKLNPQTHSHYADLNDIIESAKPIYTEQGFSVIFYEGVTTAPECVRVCADVLHTAGHKETYFYDVPLDGAGIKGNANMTKIHGKSSSVSYGRRYLMCMIWNIPTADDDGNSGGQSSEVIDEKQLSQIIDFFAELSLKTNDPGFLKFMKVSELKEIHKVDFQKAVSALEAKLKAKKRR